MATITQDIPNIEEIEAAAAKLSPGQREVLIERIREMNGEVSDPDVEAAWDTEIKRRIDEIRSGKVQCLEGEEVMKRIRAELGL
jgi:putative addiction module component (TIGR02574 family)